MIDLSIIIVTWNNEDEIGDCLASIAESTKNSEGISAEIIVIDNASSDGTTEKVTNSKISSLQIIRNEENRGFTSAVNQGLRLSKGKNIFLLNPDTVLKPRAIEKLNHFLNSSPSYGACSPLMLNEDGSIQYSVRSFPSYWSLFCEFYLFAYIFPKSKLFGRWKMKYFDYSKDSDADQPMAAALMVKRSVFDKAGLMDERFKMFFNDVDLCKRITDSGMKIRFLAEPAVIHKKGVSVYKIRVPMIRTWNRDCVSYFQKHHGNFLLLTWLKLNLKISEILRILYIKLFR